MTVEWLRRHVHALAGRGPRRSGIELTRTEVARDYVRQQLTAAGWHPRAHEINVRALLASRRPDEPPRLLVVAHLDSCQNRAGADDRIFGASVGLQSGVGRTPLVRVVGLGSRCTA